MIKKNLKKEHTLLIILFFIFMFLRIFSASPYFFIQGSDDARYLTLANNFPSHTLDNNQLYLPHPPMFPYAIHFFSFFIEDYKAGILVSLLSAAIAFFLLYKLVSMLSNTHIALGTTILFSLSQIYITLSGEILKESFAVMLILAVITYYLMFLKEKKMNYLIISTIAGAIVGITTDHALLLVPGLIVTYFIFRGNVKTWHAIIPILAVGLPYIFWLAVRIFIYTTYDFYPSSLDGTIVQTQSWGLREVLSPHYFKEIEMYLPFGLSFNPLHYIYPIIYMFNLVIAPYPTGLRFSNIVSVLSLDHILLLIIYPLLFGGCIYGIYKVLKSVSLGKIKENGMILVLLLFLIFLSPLAQKFTSTRFTVTAVVFLFMLTSYGLFQLAKTLKLKKVYTNLIIGIIIILVLYLPFYFLSNDNFIFSKEKIVEATKTANFLNQLPKDGVMAQIGYTQELNYLTDKRVMALPIDTNYLFLIERYNINYVLYGNFYSKPFEEGNEKEIFNYQTIKYIRGHPEQFRLLKVTEETYPALEKKDYIYIYEVMPN